MPGGLCTAWERKGYKFDLSMHFLTGSVSGPFYQMWDELGIIEKTEFHYHNQMGQVEGMDRKLIFSTDKEKFEQDMLAISPEDADLIKEFTDLLFGRDMKVGVTEGGVPLGGSQQVVFQMAPNTPSLF